jgi:hypothetical protein
MKIKLLIMLLFAISLFGITRDLPIGKIEVVSQGLTAANVYEMKALCDSVNAVSTRHRAKAGTVHLKADATTTAPTTYNVTDNASAVNYLNSQRTALISHFAQDSCHVNGADATTTIPGAISTSASIESIKAYAAALNTAQATHLARAHSTRYKLLGKITTAAYIAHCAKPTTTRYNILGKEAVADFIAHCAKDTSDSDSVHWVPDITFNTITYDSTNIDSSYASWIRLRSRWHGHIQAALGDGTKPHKEYTNEDSMTFSGNPSNKVDLILFANEFKTKYNQHAARAYTAETDSVHYLADANLITTASIATTEAPHWTPDVTYNSVTFDSTNTDSIYAGWNRLKSRFNSHIAVAGTGGSDPHQSYNSADSITAANATTLNTLVLLVRDYYTKFNTHLARTGTVHYTADSGVITTETLSNASGHIGADTSTFTGAGHQIYAIPNYAGRMTVGYSGTSISSGASFRTYGSLDGSNWVYVDSTATLTGAGFKHYNTNFYPYMKFYMSKRTDGTWKIEIQAEGEK